MNNEEQILQEKESVEVEEIQTEEVQVEETEPKKKKGWIVAVVIASIAAVFLIALFIVYFVFANYYKDRFFMKTSVNGVDCAGMNIEEVEALIQKQVEEYNLTIKGANNSSEIIRGTAIDIKYIGYKQIKEQLDEQKQYFWVVGLFKENDIKAEIVFDYDQEKLNAMIGQLECMKPEAQVAPVNATVVYKDGKFVIQEEVYGTQVDAAKLTEVINASVAAIDTEVNLETDGCYVQPTFTSKSTEVVEAQKAMNNYLKTTLTYNYESKEVVLDKGQFASWISVDANMNPVISQDQVKKFANTLSNQYNTPNKSGVLVTPRGKEVQLQNAVLGRAVGVDAECEQIKKDIVSGKAITREPIFARMEMAEGQYVWGNTYVEVDISEQYMWFIQNGTIVLETDVVTGKKGKNDTPTGIYNILEKVRNKTLVGRIVNGKPLYRTPVKYWMRVTWSGIGFHDAGWQASFGGDRYIANGSHGCVNMPPTKAGELYNMLPMGTPVIIHY